MEENGYNIKYISAIDAATNGSLLLNAKTYMDVGHDEYSTQSLYNNVQAAANAGVNLAFLSGNTAYWDLRSRPTSMAFPTARSSSTRMSGTTEPSSTQQV